MQKHAKTESPLHNIDYRPGLLPDIGRVSVFLFSVACLLALQLGWVERGFLFLLLALLMMWQTWSFSLGKVEALAHDANGWSLWLAGEGRVPVELEPQSFFSSFLLVLVFREHSGRRQFRLCLSRHNCTESNFRFVCRLLRMQAR